MGSGTDFFATRLDLENGLKAVEATHQLKYVRLLSQRTPVFPIYTTALDIPELGIEECMSLVDGKMILVLHATNEVVAQERTSKDGSHHFTIDYENHPSGIIFRPGGLYKDCCLLTGSVHTSGYSETSVDLYRTFRRLLFKRFLPMPNWFKGWKIGPDARHKAENGVRLITMDVNEDPSVDAQI